MEKKSCETLKRMYKLKHLQLSRYFFCIFNWFWPQKCFWPCRRMYELLDWIALWPCANWVPSLLSDGSLCFGALHHLRIVLLSVDIINCLCFKEENEEQHPGQHGLSTDATLAQRCALCQDCGAERTADVSLQRAAGACFAVGVTLSSLLRLWVLQMTCRLTQAILLMEERQQTWWFPIGRVCS